MTQADEIRRHADERYVIPARLRGERRVTIRAGTVREEMGLLPDSIAAVGGALDTEVFERFANVLRVDYHGVDSRRGANAYFTYEILPVSNRDMRSFITSQDVEQESVAGVGSATNAEPEDALDENLRERILELSPSEFQELAREYLEAKGFDDAEIEITIRMKM